MCVWEREKERVCVCVRERERESVCGCECERVREGLAGKNYRTLKHTFWNMCTKGFHDFLANARKAFFLRKIERRYRVTPASVIFVSSYWLTFCLPPSVTWTWFFNCLCPSVCVRVCAWEWTSERVRAASVRMCACVCVCVCVCVYVCVWPRSRKKCQ